jgi:TIGR03086 family protein
MSVELLQRVVNETTRVVDSVTPDQLGNGTPCTDWNVRDVINHITGGSTMFAISAEQGKVPDEQIGQLMGGDNLGDDYKGAWGAAAKHAMSAFDGLDLSKMVTLPFGEMPAGVALNIAIFDVATHACDIAESTGQEIGDTELLETALEFGKQMIGPELRVQGVFGPEQPCAPDAPVTKRLFAFSGRTV